MKTTTLKQEALPSLLAGTSRRPLKADGMSVLPALGLTGQALRFERPGPPSSFEMEAVPEDARTMLPDELRRPLLRVLGARSLTEHPATALAEAFDRLRLRPHPFDLPRLDGFVRAHAGRLGATAQHWARPQATAAAVSSYFDLEVIDAANWTEAPLARRGAFLEQTRRQDAAAGRALLETVWAHEGAEPRLRLLAAMQTGLSVADKPFLEGLEKDRAPRVRALALRLLSRLPGGTGENPALRAVMERISRSQTGLLRKRPVLKLELPATVKEQVAPAWVRENFAEVGFDELARAFDLTEQELIAAAAKDTYLLLALVLMATTDRRLDLLESVVVEHLPNALELMLLYGMQIDAMSTDERQRWVAILMRPYGRKMPTSYFTWSVLHRLLDGPAQGALIDAILDGRWIEELPDLEKQGAQWMELLASLCPQTHYARMRERLSAFDTPMTATALPLLDILIAMEKTRHHA